MAAIIAVSVAGASAQGQKTTSTVTARTMFKENTGYNGSGYSRQKIIYFFFTYLYNGVTITPL